MPTLMPVEERELLLSLEAVDHEWWLAAEARWEAGADDALELADTDSSALPDLPNKKDKTNWVEKSGGLPGYIKRIAKHLHSEKGMEVGHAIATAVNTVKKWAKGGDGVSDKTKALAEKAVAEWEAKKGASVVNASATTLYGVALSVSDRDQIVLMTVPKGPLAATGVDLTAPINRGAYELALSQARKERGIDLSLGTISFDPSAHPRDMKGQFRGVVGGLKSGESVSLPDGTRVARGQGGAKDKFFVSKGAPGVGTVGGHIEATSPAAAADQALHVSAGRAKPESLGGAVKHTSVDSAMRAHKAISKDRDARSPAESLKDGPNDMGGDVGIRKGVKTTDSIRGTKAASYTVTHKKNAIYAHDTPEKAQAHAKDLQSVPDDKRDNVAAIHRNVALKGKDPTGHRPVASQPGSPADLEKKAGGAKDDPVKGGAAVAPTKEEADANDSPDIKPKVQLDKFVKEMGWTGWEVNETSAHDTDSWTVSDPSGDAESFFEVSHNEGEGDEAWWIESWAEDGGEIDEEGDETPADEPDESWSGPTLEAARKAMQGETQPQKTDLSAPVDMGAYERALATARG